MTIEIEAVPESGNFRGAVSFDIGGVSLASSDLVLDLDFRDDGTIAGRIDTDASLLWPQPVAVVGTWTPAGEITIELRDRLPAEGWRDSPIARELGRALVLTGTRTATGLAGTITESLTGLRDARLGTSYGTADTLAEPSPACAWPRPRVLEAHPPAPEPQAQKLLAANASASIRPPM